jgi:hypothetical protein
MEKVKIVRYKCDNKQTLGKMYCKGFELWTLELDWDNNQKQTSCIPQGVYQVIKRNSSKYGDHFHITGVPNRDLILIHNGNYHTQILGCVLVGVGLSDINQDGYLDVSMSKHAIKQLLEAYPNGFELEITFGTI